MTDMNMMNPNRSFWPFTSPPNESWPRCVWPWSRYRQSRASKQRGETRNTDESDAFFVAVGAVHVFRGCLSLRREGFFKNIVGGHAQVVGSDAAMGHILVQQLTGSKHQNIKTSKSFQMESPIVFDVKIPKTVFECNLKW